MSGITFDIDRDPNNDRQWKVTVNWMNEPVLVAWVAINRPDILQQAFMKFAGSSMQAWILKTIMARR